MSTRWRFVGTVGLAGLASLGAACSSTATSGQTDSATTTTLVPGSTDSPGSTSSGSDATTTVAPVTAPPTTAPPATAPPATAAPVTVSPTTTPPATPLYQEVPPPQVPSDHTSPVDATGAVADGVYWAEYRGGEKMIPDVVLYQAFFGAECEAQATAAGDECLNDIYVSGSGREIDTMPFADAVFLSVSDASTQKSYRITPDELVKIRASSPSNGAPTGYGFTPFAALITISGGHITRFEQVWTP